MGGSFKTKIGLADKIWLCFAIAGLREESDSPNGIPSGWSIPQHWKCCRRKPTWVRPVIRQGVLSDDRTNPYNGSMFYVYILVMDGKALYVGFSTDLKRRFTEHKQEKVRSTARYIEKKLIHCEAYELQSDALRREKFLKTTEGKRLLRKQIRDVLLKYAMLPSKVAANGGVG